MLVTLPSPHLRGRRCVSVARQNLECDAPAAVSQQLLEFLGVTAHFLTVDFPDDVARVQHPLPIDGAAVQDPCDHHLPVHRAERHSLKERTSGSLTMTQPLAMKQLDQVKLKR